MRWRTWPETLHLCGPRTNDCGNQPRIPLLIDGESSISLQTARRAASGHAPDYVMQ